MHITFTHAANTHTGLTYSQTRYTQAALGTEKPPKKKHQQDDCENTTSSQHHKTKLNISSIHTCSELQWAKFLHKSELKYLRVIQSCGWKSNPHCTYMWPFFIFSLLHVIIKTKTRFIGFTHLTWRMTCRATRLRRAQIHNRTSHTKTNQFFLDYRTRHCWGVAAWCICYCECVGCGFGSGVFVLQANIPPTMEAIMIPRTTQQIKIKSFFWKQELLRIQAAFKKKRKERFIIL